MSFSWILCCARIPQRWVFAVMGSLAILNAYAMRTCLPMAITVMVTPRTTSSNDTRSEMTCPVYESTSSTSNTVGIYEWDEYTQGIILSSFFWGYIFTQIPGGLLATKFGGKYVVGLGICSTGIFTLLTPMVVKAYGATGLIVLRVLIGFGEGTTYPAMISLIAQWAPPHERSTIAALVMSGTQLGTILGTSLSGALIEHSSNGWFTVFYTFGALSILWFFAWVILCYSYPDTHPCIGEKEKTYLHETMNEHTHRETQPTPWRHMLTSVPLWALAVGKFGREWGFQMMVNDLPKYMSDVLKFSIQANGYLTALPNLAMSVVSIGSSWLADWSINSHRISRTNARKISTTVALVGPAVFLIAASYAGCEHTIVVILFTVSMGMMGPSCSGILANPLDLSPNYSGTLMAFLNIVSSLCGMLAPYVVGLLTPNRALLEWRIAFWITFVISCVSTLIFDLWGDGEVQYWNDLNSWHDKQEQLERKKTVPFLESPGEAHCQRTTLEPVNYVEFKTSK